VKCRCRWAFGHVRTARGSPLAGRASPPGGRGESRPLTSGEELLQPGDALDQVVVAARVGEPEVARGAERLTGHDRDLGLLQDVLGQVARALDEATAVLPPEQPLHRRVHVEGALGGRADHALDLVEHGHDRPATPVEGGLHLVDRGEIAGHGRQRGAL
jgi:hypothetical protein